MIIDSTERIDNTKRIVTCESDCVHRSYGKCTLDDIIIDTEVDDCLTYKDPKEK
jgi:hypothetical protein